MPQMPTLYKNPHVRGCPCLVCQTRTKGKVVPVDLGFGITIWLCERHASLDFIRADGGRHFGLTIFQALRSAGAMTPRANKAIDAFVARHRRTAREPGARRRPGSYAWADIRRRLEEALENRAMTTAAMVAFVGDIMRMELRRGRVTAASARTLRRWRAERRWILANVPAPG